MTERWQCGDPACSCMTAKTEAEFNPFVTEAEPAEEVDVDFDSDFDDYDSDYEDDPLLGMDVDDEDEPLDTPLYSPDMFAYSNYNMGPFTPYPSSVAPQQQATATPVDDEVTMTFRAPANRVVTVTVTVQGRYY